MNQSSINADPYPLPTSEPAKIGWAFIIFLTFKGFLSGAFTLVFIGVLNSAWLQGDFWFVLLGSTSFGFSLAAAFWFSGKIRSWWKFTTLSSGELGSADAFIGSASVSELDFSEVKTELARLAALVKPRIAKMPT
jgi:hypothetical protein